MLALADLEGKTEVEIKQHLDFEYRAHGDDHSVRQSIADLIVLIAYESVGNWGCDSSSWFLMRNPNNGDLFTISGSHCSCYGFEGQGDLESVDIDYLKSEKFYFSAGGYDGESENNKAKIKAYLAELT